MSSLNEDFSILNEINDFYFKYYDENKLKLNEQNKNLIFQRKQNILKKIFIEKD